MSALRFLKLKISLSGVSVKSGQDQLDVSNQITFGVNMAITNGNGIIAVIGDSGSSQEPIDSPAWPAILNSAFNSYGMYGKTIVSFALGGANFTNIKTSLHNGKTQIDTVVELAPELIIVSLGFVGFSNNINNRDIVYAVFSELKQRSPKSKILYIHKLFCDENMFPDYILKNKGVLPISFSKRKTGYLKESFNNDMLEDLVAESVNVECSSNNALKQYIASFLTNGYIGVLDVFKIARLSGLLADGLHPTRFGKALEALSIAEILKDIYPQMMWRGLSNRESMQQLFYTLLMPVNDGYIDNDNNTLKQELKDAGYTLIPTLWNYPRKTIISFTKSVDNEVGTVLFSFTNAYENTQIELSINGGNFSFYTQTNSEGAAIAEISLEAFIPRIAKDSYLLRWKINDCVYGPFTVELT